MTDAEAAVAQTLINEKMRLADNILSELCKENGVKTFGFVLMMTVPHHADHVGGMISNMFKDHAEILIRETLERIDTAEYTIKHETGNA